GRGHDPADGRPGRACSAGRRRPGRPDRHGAAGRRRRPRRRADRGPRQGHRAADDGHHARRPGALHARTVHRQRLPRRLSEVQGDEVMTEDAIAVSGLVKSFGAKRALDGFGLTVRTGEVHGFLGPNGAGKSTAIRALLGLLRTDAGDVRLLGGDPWRDAVALHRRLAYVPGDVTLWPNLTGGEVIDLLGRLRGGIREDRRAALLERFDLDPAKKARAYSKGNRQKVALVAALASEAELLILDEPTSGLDPLMEAAFRESVEEERQQGRTIL